MHPHAYGATTCKFYSIAVMPKILYLRSGDVLFTPEVPHLYYGLMANTQRIYLYVSFLVFWNVPIRPIPHIVQIEDALTQFSLFFHFQVFPECMYISTLSRSVERASLRTYSALTNSVLP